MARDALREAHCSGRFFLLAIDCVHIGTAGEFLTDKVFTLVADATGLTPEITSGLLSRADAVRTMLGSIEASGNDGEGDYSLLIEALTRLQASGGARGGQGTSAEVGTKKSKPRRSSKKREDARAAPAARGRRNADR